MAGRSADGGPTVDCDYQMPTLNQGPSPVLVTDRRSLLADIREVLGSGQILVELVKRDLKVRYKRSVLGLAWTVLNPLLMMAITTIVFSNFFGFAIDHFPIYMLSAQILFAFFAQGSVAGSTSIVSSASLTRRVYVPPALMPIASVNSAAVNLLLSLIPLFLLMAVTGGRFSWALLFLPVAMALAFLFTFGVALLLATATVFFHDTVPMYQVLLTALTYLTPIFWPLEIVPKEWMLIIQLNPLYHLVQLFRQPIYGGVLPDAAHLCAALAYSVGVAVLGWWYCQRSRNAFATYV